MRASMLRFESQRIFVRYAVIVGTLLVATFGRAQQQPSMADPPAEEQSAQQDQLVGGAAAKTVGSPSLGLESVSPDGSFSYSVQIRVPAGVRGMQPNLSLTYNSRLGNGLVG